MRSHVLLSIISTVSAVIDLFITGSYPSNYTTRTLGKDQSIITDIERVYFNITDNVIKSCVREFLGGRPDDAFVHGPTPWGNLYKKYGWTETFRILQPVSSRVVNVATSPQMLKQHIVDSNWTTNIELSQKIYNRFSTSWIEEADLEVERIVNHIDLDSFKMVYETGFENSMKLKAMTMSVTLPNLTDFGSVVAEFYASRVSIKTEFIYKASLWGNAVLNYRKSFRGHHFYSPNLDDMMTVCGISNSLLVKEVVDLAFYVDGKIVVRNTTHGSVMLMRNVEIRPL